MDVLGLYFYSFLVDDLEKTISPFLMDRMFLPINFSKIINVILILFL